MKMRHVVFCFLIASPLEASLITASVEVTGPGQFVPLELGTAIDILNPRHTWGQLPSTVNQNPPLHVWQIASGSGNVAGGIITFEALTDGPILLAVTTRWGEGGNASGGWLPELTTETEFLADGWTPYSSPMLVQTVGFPDPTHEFTAYIRDSIAGERFTYRTEKYLPPLVMTTQFTAPELADVPEPSAWATWGVLGLCVAGVCWWRRRV